MNSNRKKNFFLIIIVVSELTIGFIFLFNFYQQKIVHKVQDPDKIAVIKKENLIFPEESEFKYYYELQPNTKAMDEPEWLGYQAKYTYNADGLNERFNYEVEKPSNTFRIITLGDSFTYGHYVNTEDNWPEQLEDLLNKPDIKMCNFERIEVINLSMTGFDIPYLVRRYKDIGAKYQPDLIIWFESGSGFIRLNEFLREGINTCEKDENIAYTSEFPTKSHYCWNVAQKKMDEKYSYEEIEQIVTNHLDDFFSTLIENKVLFFTFNEYDLKDEWKITLEKWKVRYPQASFLSVIPNLHILKQTLSDGHPNVQGHKTIASSIYKYLENNVINQCKQK